MGNGSGVSRGDRNRNARLGRLRELVPVTNAIAGIDLAGGKQILSPPRPQSHHRLPGRRSPQPCGCPTVHDVTLDRGRDVVPEPSGTLPGGQALHLGVNHTFRRQESMQFAT